MAEVFSTTDRTPVQRLGPAFVSGGNATPSVTTQALSGKSPSRTDRKGDEMARDRADSAVLPEYPPMDLAVPAKLETADFAFG